MFVADAHRSAFQRLCVATTSDASTRLVDYFERYLEEQRGGAIRRSAIDRRSTIRRFVESAGNLPVAAYTAEHVSAFKRALRDYPKKMTAKHTRPMMDEKKQKTPLPGEVSPEEAKAKAREFAMREKAKI